MGIIKGTVALTASAIGRSNRKRNLRKIGQANERNKKILNLGTSSISNVLSNAIMQNVIVSGGSGDIRLQFILHKCLQDSNANIPVVILHEGNSFLENALCYSIPTNRYIRIINKHNPFYDPIFRMNSTEAGVIISEAFPDIDENGVLLINTICRILQYKGTPYLKKFENCPYDQLSTGVVRFEQSGLINQFESTTVQNNISTGLSSRSQVEMTFSKLFTESDVFPEKNELSRATSILDCSNHKGGVIVIDINTMQRDNIVSIISAEIKTIIKTGNPLSVIIDAQSISKNKLLLDVLSCTGPSLSWMLSSPNISEMIGKDDGALSKWLSSSGKAIMFSHNQFSSQLLSKEFGEYDHIDVQQSLGGNNGIGQQFGFHYGGQAGIAQSIKREPRVKPEEIVNLAPNNYFLLDNCRGELGRGTIK